MATCACVHCSHMITFRCQAIDYSLSKHPDSWHFCQFVAKKWPLAKMDFNNHGVHLMTSAKVVKSCLTSAMTYSCNSGLGYGRKSRTTMNSILHFVTLYLACVFQIHCFKSVRTMKAKLKQTYYNLKITISKQNNLQFPISSHVIRWHYFGTELAKSRQIQASIT